MIIPSSRSTSFCNFCTERSANSARASAYDENNQAWAVFFFLKLLKWKCVCVSVGACSCDGLCQGMQMTGLFDQCNTTK